MSDYPRRLIEVDLPIKRISAHAVREKNIRQGHISTLHVWWARRPLAACRAVVCAALWPDPADERCPQEFRDRATLAVFEFAKKVTADSKLGQEHCSPDTWAKWVALVKQGSNFDTRNPSHLNVLRFALLDFVADFADWDNGTVGAYLETARALTQAAHEALGGEKGTRPLVVDPFAGGGSIPLEALRVGADALASDLNPVAVLLNKVVLEYIPKYGQQLADGVRKWGQWVKEEAEKELHEYYRRDPDDATPIAYLWARTVLSDAPGASDVAVEIPLLRSMWLSKRKGFWRALRWRRDSKGRVMTEVVERQDGDGPVRVRRPLLEVFSPTMSEEVGEGTVKGGAATSPVSGYTTPASRVKEQLRAAHGGAGSSRLYAVYVEGAENRRFRLSSEHDVQCYALAARAAGRAVSLDPDAFPRERINDIRPYKNTRGVSAVTRIGCSTFADLYNPRQALAIRTFYQVLGRAPLPTRGDAAGLSSAVKTLLALAANRLVSQNTSVSRWDASRLTIKGAFSKQALAVVWDYAEANPFSGATADWQGALGWVIDFVMANCCIDHSGTAMRASATAILLPTDSASAVVTDPPYFAAIPYADLSDFFYVWLSRGLASVHPELFGAGFTDKCDELIVTNAQKGPGGRKKDEEFFREGMTAALLRARDVIEPNGISVIVYAEGTTAGWEAILGAIIDAGWTITSSWPIDTEMADRTQAHGSASLQSSIHLVCRPRESSSGPRAAGVGDWRDVLSALPKRIHDWMPRLAAEGVVGADAIFACLGPAIEIFSRHSRVEKSNGEQVTLKEYLVEVWAAVEREALNMIFQGADASGYEEDARLTAMWLWTLKTDDKNIGNATESEGDEDNDDEDDGKGKKAKPVGGFALEYDAARKISQGLGVHLEALKHLVEVKGDIARLLSVNQRSKHLFGKDAEAATVKGRRKKAAPQTDLFKDLDLPTEGELETRKLEADNATAGRTTLDRLHQSMLLFAAGRGEALKRFLVEDGVGRNPLFWRLAQSLAALYPAGTEEKRWVEGVQARKKGLGL